MSEFNLSKWIKTEQHPLAPYVTVTAVEEFIRLLKEKLSVGGRNINTEINKLAGDKLNGME